MQKLALLLNSLLEQLAFSKYILIVSYLILDSVPKTSHGEQSCPNQADILAFAAEGSRSNGSILCRKMGETFITVNYICSSYSEL